MKCSILDSVRQTVLMLLFHGCSLLQAIDLMQFPSVLMSEYAQQKKQQQSGSVRRGVI